MLIESRRGGSVALTWNRTIDWDLEDWRSRAACKDTDPDLFFPVGTTGQAISQIESAKAVCGQCEASTECLEPLATNQESGVWGGASEEERRKLRKTWLAQHRRAS